MTCYVKTINESICTEDWIQRRKKEKKMTFIKNECYWLPHELSIFCSFGIYPFDNLLFGILHFDLLPFGQLALPRMQSSVRSFLKFIYITIITFIPKLNLFVDFKFSKLCFTNLGKIVVSSLRNGFAHEFDPRVISINAIAYAVVIFFRK